MPWTTEQKIFIIEAYFRQKSIHTAQLQFKERFRCREFPVHSMIYRWVNKFRTPHSLSTVCKGHYTLTSALPGLPSPNMASLDHSGSRMTMSGQWQSAPGDMSRCLASSSQHLVDTEGSSGSSSGSNRMVPPPHLKRIIGMATAVFPWPIDLPQVWPAVVAAFTGLEPPDFYMWGYLKDRVYGNNPQTIPDLKAAIKAAIRAIPMEECGRVIESLARRIQMCLQRQGVHLEHIFWAPVKQRFL